MTTDGADDRALALRQQVETILAAEGLGRSPTLERLLRFLLASAMEARAPKEVEIAGAVLSRLPDAREADASARVYIHRLRRKLDDFYAGQGRDQAWRLILPKGSYLLGVERIVRRDEQALVSGDEPEPAHEREIRAGSGQAASAWWKRALLAALVVGAALTGWAIGTWDRDPGQLEVVRRSAVWSPVLTGDHGVALVLGDYYIFGERDKQGNVSRLIRKFDVNSAGDLDRLKMMEPASNGRYANLGLAYLPVGAGAALRAVSPVLGAARRGLTVTTVSQLSAQTMQNASLVYLGYISGLGVLRAPMFDGSRFAVGSSFDEIVDQRTGKHYLASSHLEESDVPGEDYALISAFRGVLGNRIIIIAGTRDAALMQAAQFVTEPATLARLHSVAEGGRAFEVLLGISALRNVGLAARIVAISQRSNPSWQENAANRFPDSFPSSLEQ